MLFEDIFESLLEQLSPKQSLEGSDSCGEGDEAFESRGILRRCQSPPRFPRSSTTRIKFQFGCFWQSEIRDRFYHVQEHA